MKNKHPFHLVNPSPWPILISCSLLGLTIGAVSFFHSFTFSLPLLFSSLFFLMFTSLLVSGFISYLYLIIHMELTFFRYRVVHRAQKDPLFCLFLIYLFGLIGVLLLTVLYLRPFIIIYEVQPPNFLMYLKGQQGYTDTMKQWDDELNRELRNRYGMTTDMTPEQKEEWYDKWLPPVQEVNHPYPKYNSLTREQQRFADVMVKHKIDTQIIDYMIDHATPAQRKLVLTFNKNNPKAGLQYVYDRAHDNQYDQHSIELKENKCNYPAPAHFGLNHSDAVRQTERAFYHILAPFREFTTTGGVEKLIETINNSKTFYYTNPAEQAAVSEALIRLAYHSGKFDRQDIAIVLTAMDFRGLQDIGGETLDKNRLADDFVQGIQHFKKELEDNELIHKTYPDLPLNHVRTFSESYPKFNISQFKDPYPSSLAKDLAQFHKTINDFSYITLFAKGEVLCYPINWAKIEAQLPSILNEQDYGVKFSRLRQILPEPFLNAELLKGPMTETHPLVRILTGLEKRLYMYTPAQYDQLQAMLLSTHDMTVENITPESLDYALIARKAFKAVRFDSYLQVLQKNEQEVLDILKDNVVDSVNPFQILRTVDVLVPAELRKDMDACLEIMDLIVEKLVEVGQPANAIITRMAFISRMSTFDQMTWGNKPTMDEVAEFLEMLQQAGKKKK